MKILVTPSSAASPEPVVIPEKVIAPAPAPVPLPLPAQDEAVVMKAINDLAQRVDRLNHEFNDMRQTLQAVQAAQTLSRETPKEKPIDPPLPSEPTDQRTPLVEPISGSVPVDLEERKVAFLTKLWDYLNEVAFEVPPRKNN